MEELKQELPLEIKNIILENEDPCDRLTDLSRLCGFGTYKPFLFGGLN